MGNSRSVPSSDSAVVINYPNRLRPTRSAPDLRGDWDPADSPPAGLYPRDPDALIRSTRCNYYEDNVMIRICHGCEGTGYTVEHTIQCPRCYSRRAKGTPIKCRKCEDSGFVEVKPRKVVCTMGNCPFINK